MSARSTKRPRVLHLHSSFEPGGKERRAVRLMNAFGTQLEHAIASGVPGAVGAAREVERSVKVTYPQFPSLTGWPTPGPKD